jgi:hypothetical protein
MPDPELTLDDVTRHIPDRALAAAALAELQRLQHLELIDVYLPAGWVAAGHRDFNVWLGHVLVPPQGRRMTPQEWCERWLADPRLPRVAPMETAVRHEPAAVSTRRPRPRLGAPLRRA